MRRVVLGSMSLAGFVLSCFLWAWVTDAMAEASAGSGHQVIWVLARAVPKGGVLGPDDLTRKSISGRASPPGALADPREVLGMRAVRALVAGTVLRRDQFKPEPLVQRGQRVQIVLEQGALRIVAPGEALEGGGAGERIRVLNTSSRQVVVARVEDHKSVRVEF